MEDDPDDSPDAQAWDAAQDGAGAPRRTHPPQAGTLPWHPAELARRVGDRMPPLLRSSRWAPSATAATGAVLVAALAIAALALVLRPWESGASRLVEVPQRPSTATPTGTPGASERAAGPAAEAVPATGSPVTRSPDAVAARATVGAIESGGQVVVHVVGAVLRPGLVHLSSGSRVADAVNAAGGAAPHADLARVNLARQLMDGEQVFVPRPGEAVPPVVGVPPGATTAGGPSAPGGFPAVPSAPVDLNTAGLAELDTLPGVGPVLAQRIVDWRTENGRFSSVDDLAEVSGIGEKLLARLRPRVRV